MLKKNLLLALHAGDFLHSFLELWVSSRVQAAAETYNRILDLTKILVAA